MTDESLAEQIERHLAEGETRRALVLSSRLVEQAPDDLEAQRLRARCLEAEGRWGRAAKAYDDLARRVPGDEDLMLRLARARVLAGKPGAALEVLDDLGEAPQVRELRARALTGLGRYEEAAAHWRELPVARGDVATRAERARALARAGDARGAAAALGWWRRFHPAITGARAEVRARRRGGAGVAAWWAAAAPAGAVPPELVVPEMRACLEAGEPRAALERFAALRVAPDSGEAAEVLAGAIVALGADVEVLRPALAQARPQKPTFWGRLVDTLVRAGSFDGARALLEALPEHRETDRLRERLRSLLDQLPDDLPSGRPRKDGLKPQVTVQRADGATTVVVVLGPLPSRLLLPALTARNVDVISLHDVRELSFLRGVDELAADWPGTVNALRALTQAEGPRRVMLAGSSAVGYTAVLLGVELGAEAVVAFSPPADMRPEKLATYDAGLTTMARLIDEAPDRLCDLREVLADPASPRVCIWFGAENPRDRRNAERLADLPTTTIHAVPGADRHNVLLDMIAQGLVDEALDELLAEGAQLEPWSER